MTIAAPTPTPTTTQEYICPSCGRVSTRGRQAVTGVLQAVGWFLLVPAIAAILVLILGGEAVAQNSPFIAIAWVVLGLPAAGGALRKAFSRACPDCGSKKAVALATPEGQRLLSNRPESSALAGHTGAPTAITVLPDGRPVSGSKDATVRIWDATRAPGEPIVLTGHTASITTVAVLADGRIASGSKDTTVRVWDPTGRTPPIVLTEHKHPVTAVAGLPDGRVASADKKGNVWTRHPDSPAETGVTQRAGHTSGVKSVEALIALPDGRLVAAGWDQTLRVLDPDGAVPPRSHYGHGSPVSALVLLRDGRVMSGDVISTQSGTSGSLRIHSMDDGEGGVFLSHAFPVSGVAELPDGRVASVASDGMLRIWDLADDPRDAKATLIKAGSALLAALPDGRVITDGPKNALRITVVPPREG